METQQNSYAMQYERTLMQKKGPSVSRRSALGDITNRKSTNAGAGKPGLKAPQTAREQSASQILPAAVGGSVTARACVDIDAKDADNPQMATEYVKDIFRYFRETEGRRGPSANYMQKQNDINEKMRSILIDWLVEVHLKFKLMPETMFLTTNLIDRYLEITQVTRQKLQLVGVTCMLIASKYEEIYAPEIRDFVLISDRAYTRDEILKMERVILNTLRFNMTVVSPYIFLQRFCKAAAADRKTKYLSHFLTERTLQEYSMLKYLPSTIAAASLCLAINTVKSGQWTDTLRQETRYAPSDLTPCIDDMVRMIKKSSSSSLCAVKKKYANQKYLEVSKIKIEDTL